MARSSADTGAAIPALDGIGALAFKRLEELARCSEPGPGVTRFPFTPEHRAALGLLSGWMEEAGLSVSMDAAGTLIGRREGPPGAKTLLIGSHQDSVRQGGKYDGALGVVLPICIMQALKDTPLAVAVEVLAFADEEGARFPTALIGSRALAGTLDPAVFALKDRDSVALGDAMRAFGCDPDRVPDLRRDPATIAGFIETHIEQGPVLEQADTPLGVVTAICGIERWRVTLTGATGHAGTTPMGRRRDALCAAAEIVLDVERHCGKEVGGVGTVGALRIAPDVVNAIPGLAEFTIELRAPDDVTREAAGSKIAALAHERAAARGLDAVIERTYAQAATPCDDALSGRLARAAGGAPRLPSGATHDASAMAVLCPVAMIFTRCKNGLSHHPHESVIATDLGAAAKALGRFLAGAT